MQRGMRPSVCMQVCQAEDAQGMEVLLRIAPLIQRHLTTAAHAGLTRIKPLHNRAADLDCRRQVAARAPAHTVLAQCEPLVQVL